MIRKSARFFLSSAMLLGLVACNSNSDTAMVRNNDNRYIGNNNLTDTVNVRNDRSQDWNVERTATRDRMDDELSTSLDNRYDRAANWTREDSRGFWGGNGSSDETDNPNISSLVTHITSKNYPHTKAVLIQDAKFKFVQMYPQAGKMNIPGTQSQTGKQMQTTKAPTQQQPQAPKQQTTQNNAQAPKQQATQNKTQATAGISQIAQKVIDLTNAERNKNGLPSLTGDAKLSDVAQKKSTDMQQNNYFSHTSPTYGSPFDMMRDFGVTYKTAGENIAQGQQTPEAVVQAWMNSEGHRKNILSRDFTHIGIGYDNNGHHWTQMFIGK